MPRHIFNEHPIKTHSERNSFFKKFKLFLLQFENAFKSELWGFAAVSLLVFIVYMLRNYLKSIILALKLPGPPVVPLLGNCLLIKEKDCKFYP